MFHCITLRWRLQSLRLPPPWVSTGPNNILNLIDRIIQRYCTRGRIRPAGDKLAKIEGLELESSELAATNSKEAINEMTCGAVTPTQEKPQFDMTKYLFAHGMLPLSEHLRILTSQVPSAFSTSSISSTSPPTTSMASEAQPSHLTTATIKMEDSEDKSSSMMKSSPLDVLVPIGMAKSPISASSPPPSGSESSPPMTPSGELTIATSADGGDPCRRHSQRKPSVAWNRLLLEHSPWFVLFVIFGMWE
ncbi:unnamed protein product [Caenorhabditis auriculariae]|uniref:Uncharacterized protein n=1 Tax=Caenorhabditis auriculariae TaxID=2777116 RepID=A0A8S1H2B9_9PELO|nr:unnamed protein product [Caenorhabditis auriculariae]